MLDNNTKVVFGCTVISIIFHLVVMTIVLQPEDDWLETEVLKKEVITLSRDYSQCAADYAKLKRESER